MNPRYGQEIGAGGVGIVYSLEPHEKSGTPRSHSSLVAKNRLKYLLRYYVVGEAWFYEELQSLQGSVVPWRVTVRRTLRSSYS